MTTKEGSKTVLHLVEGELEVKFYKSLEDIKLAHVEYGWPPYPIRGACVLKEPDNDHPLPWCKNVSCEGECYRHMVWSRRHGKMYYYCTCPSVEA